MSRPGPGWIPNQHGAWAMLASPLLVGVLAGGVTWVHLPLAAFWFAGYFAFFAASQWLKAKRRARWFPPVRFYGVLAVALGAVVAALEPGLLLWAPAFVVPLTIGLVAAAHRHERAVTAGLAMTAASALMTVVSYDAGPGTDLERAWLLAVIQLAYFAGTVLYVKTVIRERDNPTYYRVSVGFHAVVLAAAAFTTSLPVTVVFVGLFTRAVLVPPWRPTPKQAGIGEVVATVAVAVTSLLTL